MWHHSFVLHSNTFEYSLSAQTWCADTMCESHLKCQRFWRILFWLLRLNLRMKTDACLEFFFFLFFLSKMLDMSVNFSILLYRWVAAAVKTNRKLWIHRNVLMWLRCHSLFCFYFFHIVHFLSSWSSFLVPLDSPDESLKAPATTLHLPPGYPPRLHAQPFLVCHLPLVYAPLGSSSSALARQDLYAGAFCHQCVPGAHPPHPTDLRLLSPFSRLPLHSAAAQGEEDPKGGDVQRGDGWRVQGRREERGERRRQGGGDRLGWRWQWVVESNQSQNQSDSSTESTRIQWMNSWVFLQKTGRFL